MNDTSRGIAAQQKYLGNKGLIVFLALLSAFVPLSTDLYLPALPTMTRSFQVPEYLTNLTLILFFVFFSLATLVWGPLSDKYGRRPVLISGLTGYTVASALCAASVNVYQLIIFRVLQAAGGGAASAVATAIVKDVYQGKKRESVLALVQSMVLISPALAPVIGALLLQITSWRGVFIAQALIGVAVVAGSAAFRETLEPRSTGGILRSIGRLGVVLKNPSFTLLLIIFSTVSVAVMAFISTSSYIYQNTFGLSSQNYSYFFTFNAIGMILGPYIYIKLSRRFGRFSIVCACFAFMVLSGFLVIMLGYTGPWGFAAALLPSTVASSCIRPPGTFLMLDQQAGDTGSASSLMTASQTVMGSVGMIIVSFSTGGHIQVVSMLNLICGVLCGALWLITKRSFIKNM